MADTPKRLCPLGYGHTSHVWELTGKYPLETGVYFCVGQPFSDGTDPATDPMPPDLPERIIAALHNRGDE
jgi:hypothetical protein